jgi:hypothetical protein
MVKKFQCLHRKCPHHRCTVTVKTCRHRNNLCTILNPIIHHHHIRHHKVMIIPVDKTFDSVLIQRSTVTTSMI